MTPQPLTAVLWDLDGTLVDTEPYWMAAEGPLVESFGGTWSPEQALSMVGLGLNDAAAILQANGVRMPNQEIVDHLTAEVMRQLREQGVPFRPGARELLAQLRREGIKTALVTMSLRRMALSVAELIEFDAFDAIIAGDDVSHPKPHPEPYLRGMTALGVDAAQTVAIEDSPTGVRSALDAGAGVIGVPLMVPLSDAGADELWPTLSERTVADLREFQARRMVDV